MGALLVAFHRSLLSTLFRTDLDLPFSAFERLLGDFLLPLSHHLEGLAVGHPVRDLGSEIIILLPSDVDAGLCLLLRQQVLHNTHPSYRGYARLI